MFEMVIETTNMPTLYALYVSIILGFTLKYIWTWQIEDTFIESICAASEVRFKSIGTSIKPKHQFIINSVISWIAKFIRRKTSPRDDAGDHPSFLLN